MSTARIIRRNYWPPHSAHGDEAPRSVGDAFTIHDLPRILRKVASIEHFIARKIPGSKNN